jgi:hypothetical protein
MSTTDERSPWLDVDPDAMTVGDLLDEESRQELKLEAENA